MPWEAQAANNNPELLVWRQEATCITTTVPGLYQLTLGFFTHSPLVIQVCVNGEPILTRAPGDSSHVLPPRLSSGGGKAPTTPCSSPTRRRKTGAPRPMR